MSESRGWMMWFQIAGLVLLLTCQILLPHWSAMATQAVAQEKQGLKPGTESADTPQPSEGEPAQGYREAEGKAREQREGYKLEEVTVTGKIVDEATANMPAVVETVTAAGIERMNAVETQDVFKYMPGSYLRKLYPGSTNSPLVIRGNSSELTARTLVLMDGFQISDFLAAGHANAPKWFFVAPEEIEKVDLIYGPYSAALSGNSLSGTAIITTHFPERLEINADAKYFYQRFHEYRTEEDLHSYTAYGSVGDKIGKFSFNVWYRRLEADINPISFVTRLASTGKKPVGNPVTGWVQDTDPQGQSRFILGSPGVQDLTNNIFKVKLAYDLTPNSQIRFVSALWDYDHYYDSPETYLRDARGNPVYYGKVDIGGVSFNLNPSTFTYSRREMLDLLNGLSYTLDTPGGLKLTATASSYHKLSDLNRQSSTAPPAAEFGGAGKVTDVDGGWYILDLKAAYDIKWLGLHTLSAGYHFDHYFTDSEVWNATDWLRDVRTTLNQGSRGKTRTHALFLEDTWKLHEKWSIYLGGRYEWWSGFDGAKYTDTPLGRIISPLEDRYREDFSPKFSTTFTPTEDWRLRFSMALATRYPTVGELFYGGITPQGVISEANPDLKPESSFAKDFTITRLLGKDGEARLTFFQDDIDDAIYMQTNSYTLVRNYQNVEKVRTRGIEFAINKRRFLIDGLGVFANVAWTDSEILRNDNVPESVGKKFPRVSEWRVKGVLTYSPTDRLALTFASHYASKPFNTLDNSDKRGGYGGIDDFVIFDARVSYRFLDTAVASVGVDNITDERYHIFHPYPRRTFLVELKWTY